MKRKRNKVIPKRLRRGMYVRLSDGSIELVTAVFRLPANTKFRKKDASYFNHLNGLLIKSIIMMWKF